MGRLLLLLCTLYCWLLTACSSSPRTVEKGESVTIYTNTYQPADKELFYLFEKASGIKVNIIQAPADTLLQRLREPDALLPKADLLLLKGQCYLQQADEENLLQAAGQRIQTGNSWLPADTASRWQALTFDPLVLGYSADSILGQTENAYASLATYTGAAKLQPLPAEDGIATAFAAGMLANRQEESTRQWLSAYRTRQQQAAAGEPMLGLLLLSQYLQQSPLRYAALAEQAGQGSYAVVSGIGLLQNAPAADHARRLLAFLAGTDIQRRYAASHREFPVSREAPLTEALQPFEAIRLNQASTAVNAQQCRQAAVLLRQAGF